MSERAFVFLSGDTGNDANDGSSEDYPVQTYAVAEGLGDRKIIVCFDDYGVRENIAPSVNKEVTLVGAKPNSLRYCIRGAADTNPALLIENYTKVILNNVPFYSATANKPFVRINNAPVGITWLRTIGDSELRIGADGQIGFDIQSFTSGYEISNMLFQFSAGPYPNARYVKSMSAAPVIAPLTFRNCVFIFSTDALGLFTESQIYEVAGGAVDCCRFVNCAWVRTDGVSYEILLDEDTYPSGATAAHRDPMPLTNIGNSILLDELNTLFLKLPTNYIMGSSVQSDKDDEIDNIETVVESIAGSTVVIIDVPEKLIRPSAGSVIYRIVANLYDREGNPLAPDSAPTIRITNRDESVERVVETNMTQVVGQTGQYYYDYTITSASTVEKEMVRIKVIENAVTTYHREVTEVYIEAEPGSGTGAVVVDHDYGGADNMRIYDIETSAGIEGADIFAFLKTDWDAGNRDTRFVGAGGYARGYAKTGSDGRWLSPMTLDPDTYIIWVNDMGVHEFDPFELVVS